MRNKSGIDLTIVVIITLLLITAVVFSSSLFPRIILGLPFLLFLPGYAFISALFPRKSRFSALERFAYSIALSIALVTLTVLVLNYTWSITLYPVLWSLSGLVLLFSVIAFLRRRNLPIEETAYLPFNWHTGWSKQNWLEKALVACLAVSILGVIVSSVYTYHRPQPGFTELFFLDENGRVSGFPQHLIAGQKGKISLVIRNHENQSASYQVKVVGQDCQVNVDGKMLNEFNVVIPDQEKQTYNVDFAFNKHGPNQKLEFDLYKSGSSEVYLRTYLKVEVE